MPSSAQRAGAGYAVIARRNLRPSLPTGQEVLDELAWRTLDVAKCNALGYRRLRQHVELYTVCCSVDGLRKFALEAFELGGRYLTF